ncbi:hypothetical protein L9F63_012367, partial [Diploptera punctata]
IIIGGDSRSFGYDFFGEFIDFYGGVDDDIVIWFEDTNRLRSFSVVKLSVVVLRLLQSHFYFLLHMRYMAFTYLCYR